MLFKDISFLELFRPFCSAEQNIFANWVESIYGTILLNYFEFRQVVQEEKSF